MKLDHYLTPYTKINSKWTKDLNLRTESIELLDENTGQMLHDTGFGSNFLDIAPKAQGTKEKVDKLDFMKIYKFCASKAKKQTTQLKNRQWT